MESGGIREAFETVFDQALVFHGFTPYMRDYELVLYCVAGPATGIEPAFERLLFKGCVSAKTETVIDGQGWVTSQDDRLVASPNGDDPETGEPLEGFVWGVRWQCMYPGAELIAESSIAGEWQERCQVAFHEARIETNAQLITLVFQDLEPGRVDLGYSPFVAEMD